MTQGTIRALGAVLTLSAALLWASSKAEARVAGDSKYDKARTYSGALRYLRVDRGFYVTEKDPDAAYLIFDYPIPGQKDRTSTGTIEIVQVGDGVKIYVKIAKMPEYHERVLRDELLRKLSEEYGEPPKRRPDKRKGRTKQGDKSDSAKAKSSSQYGATR